MLWEMFQKNDFVVRSLWWPNLFFWNFQLMKKHSYQPQTLKPTLRFFFHAAIVYDQWSIITLLKLPLFAKKNNFIFLTVVIWKRNINDSNDVEVKINSLKKLLNLKFAYSAAKLDRCLFVCLFVSMIIFLLFDRMNIGNVLSFLSSDTTWWYYERALIRLFNSFHLIIIQIKTS